MLLNPSLFQATIIYKVISGARRVINHPRQDLQGNALILRCHIQAVRFTNSIWDLASKILSFLLDIQEAGVVLVGYYLCGLMEALAWVEMASSDSSDPANQASDNEKQTALSAIATQFAIWSNFHWLPFRCRLRLNLSFCLAMQLKLTNGLLQMEHSFWS